MSITYKQVRNILDNAQATYDEKIKMILDLANDKERETAWRNRTSKRNKHPKNSTTKFGASQG